MLLRQNKYDEYWGVHTEGKLHHINHKSSKHPPQQVKVKGILQIFFSLPLFNLIPLQSSVCETHRTIARKSPIGGLYICA